jgi:hypothetical protein
MKYHQARIITRRLGSISAIQLAVQHHCQFAEFDLVPHFQFISQVNLGQ